MPLEINLFVGRPQLNFFLFFFTAATLYYNVFECFRFKNAFSLQRNQVYSFFKIR